ncbi:histidine phosphatase [Micrococcus sp. HMSC067E09]|uniref:SixA phosphatase family protein n=1 Tax=Micrococcus sp. HMSC067E09 TaxID=1739367 RepID=UPI0008A63DBD|nr:histidine phosphatase family protein [Micrococcus sp. HMSC067E09]OFR86482.1 histidine phosphatase [Micrococcus sp. HMSC067E09]
MARHDVKTLLVMRHATAAWAADGVDHHRPLTGHGHEEAEAMGRWMAERGRIPDQIVCSDALRTRQTCVWVGEALGEKAPTPYLDPRLYGADATGALSIVNETEETARSLLVIGHMPWVQALGMRLMSADSDEEAALDMAQEYPPAGLQVFEVEKPWAELDGRDARLVSFITP